MKRVPQKHLETARMECARTLGELFYREKAKNVQALFPTSRLSDDFMEYLAHLANRTTSEQHLDANSF